MNKKIIDFINDKQIAADIHQEVLSWNLAHTHEQAILDINHLNHTETSQLKKGELFADTFRGKTPTAIWKCSIIALAEKRVAGFALNYLRNTEDFGTAKISGVNLYLYILDVHPDFQGLGLGSKLLAQSIVNFRTFWGDAFGSPKPFLVTIQTNKNNLRMQHIIEQTFHFTLKGQKYYPHNKLDNVYELKTV